MVSKKSRAEVRIKKHNRLRNRFAGTAERPRLAVFRSNNHMYAQIIDDSVGNTLVAASTLEKDVKAQLEKTNNVEAAAKLGEVIAKKALINKMVKSSTKTAVKKVMVAVEAKDKAAAQAALVPAVSAIDKAYTKGIFHKNAAARKKSSLTRLVNSL